MPPVTEQVATTTPTEPGRRAPFRLAGPLRPLLGLAPREADNPIADAELGAKALRRDAAYKRTLALADILALLVALQIGIVALGNDSLTSLVAILLPLLVVVGKAIGLYDRDQHLIRKTTLDEAPRLFQIATLTALVLSLGQHEFISGSVSGTHIVTFWAVFFVGIVILRAASRAMVTRFSAPERCAVLGDIESAEWLSAKCDGNHGVPATIVGRIPLAGCNERERGEIPVLGTADSLGPALTRHEVDRVIIAPGSEASDPEHTLHAIRDVKALGSKVTVLPRLFEVVGSSVEFDDIDGATLLAVRRNNLTFSSRFLKRAMDLVGSTLCLALLAPLFAVFAIAIKISSAGPVFFRQRRIGARNDEFEIVKFRTMYEDADARKDELRRFNEADGGLFKIAEDPRVTPVGRFLRRTSLDELPQLLNVLRGQMSLVGPRPLVPDEDRQVEGWQRRRLMVKPGMTGIWQILGSSRIPLHEMVKIDYLYGANWSIWLDVKVLLRTVPYVLARRGL